MKKINLILMVLLVAVMFFNSCKKDDDDDLPQVIVNSNISSDITWSKGKVYVIQGSIYVDNSATLTIEPGTTINFDANSGIYVGYSDNGTLIANGTEDQPIKFTTNAQTPTPGAWHGIFFYGHTGALSSLKYVTIEYAGSGSNYAINMDDCKITIENCTIKKSGNGGVYSGRNNTGGFVSFINNKFVELNDYAISVHPMDVHTIGTGNVFDGNELHSIEIRAGRYENSTNKTWLNHGVPYFVTGSITIDGSLTIAAGNTFKCQADSKIEVGYFQNTTLIAEGTATEKITFTTNHTSPSAGSWSGFVFYNKIQAATSLKYCEILWAGKEGSAAIVLSEDSKLTIQNCHISDSDGYGIYAYYFKGFSTPFQNNKIEKCANHVMFVNFRYLNTLGTGNVFLPASNKGIEIGNERYQSSTNQTWLAQRNAPYYLNTGICIDGSLTIGDSCIFKLGADAYIEIGYYNNTALTVNKASFTSDSEVPQKGDWQKIVFYNKCQNVVFTDCKFLYGGKYERMLHLYGDSNARAVITLNNCELAYSSSYALYGYYGTVNNLSSNNFHDNDEGNYLFEE